MWLTCNGKLAVRVLLLHCDYDKYIKYIKYIKCIKYIKTKTYVLFVFTSAARRGHV